jgi:hypothetical protein
MKIIYCIAALLVFACSALAGKEQTPAQIPPLMAKYKVAICGYMGEKLKDPYTAMYRFGTPYKGRFSSGILGGNKKYFGWIVPTWINAKNGFGGYTGEQPYLIILLRW